MFDGALLYVIVALLVGFVMYRSVKWYTDWKRDSLTILVINTNYDLTHDKEVSAEDIEKAEVLVRRGVLRKFPSESMKGKHVFMYKICE